MNPARNSHTVCSRGKEYFNGARKIINIILILLCLILSVAPAHAFYAREAINDVEEKFGNIETYKAVYRLKTNTADQSYTTTGMVLFKRPDKIKTEMMLILKQPMNQAIVSNGEIMWVKIQQENQVSKIDLANLKESFGESYFDYQEPNMCKPFKEVERSSLKFIGTEEVNGENAYVFEAKPSKLQIAQGNLPEGSRVKIWVSTNTGLQHRVSVFDESGKEIIQHEFKDFVINEFINDYEFEFKPPSDSKVTDITDEIKNKMLEVLNNI